MPDRHERVGKNDLPQLLGIIRAAMQGDVGRFILGGHEVDLKDFLTAGSAKRTFSVETDLELKNCGRFRWSWTFNVAEGATTFESVTAIPDSEEDAEKRLFQYKERKIIFGESSESAQFSFKGSVLSFMNLPSDSPLAAIRNELKGISGLGVMDPMAISAPAQASKAAVLIEEKGKNLPAFISRLSSDQSKEFVQTVLSFYGKDKLSSLQVKGRQFGWKRLAFTELSKTLDSVHLSYGTLRFMAMAAMKYSHASILYFDEVENGINQEGFKALLDLLTSYSGKQVFITSHSAVFLNYFSDDLARKGVYFLYRGQDHRAKAVRFFDSLAEKSRDLEYLGAGEIMSMTDLKELGERLSSRQSEVSEPKTAFRAEKGAEHALPVAR